MDDDAPLSALASKMTKTAKKGSLDDDVPLASLASSKPAASKASGAAAAKGGGAKGRGKGPQGKGKRRRPSSSSTSSSSSSSSSESGKPKKPRMKQKNKLLRKKSTDSGGDLDGGGPIQKKKRSLKESVVAELLCRWWYALPDWPPPAKDPYWAEQLSKRNYKLVDVEEWEFAKEMDSQNRQKVYGLKQFRGVYRNSAGDFIDLRPQETCPCQRNMMKKDMPELYNLLIKAYEGQLTDLKNSKYDESQLEAVLKAALTRHRNSAAQARQVGSVKR